MKSFVIRDIAGLMTGWEFSGYAVDGEDVGTDWGRAIADIESMRPVRVYQDGTVYGRKGLNGVDIETTPNWYTDEEFEQEWREYGYPDMPIED